MQRKHFFWIIAVISIIATMFAGGCSNSKENDDTVPVSVSEVSLSSPSYTLIEEGESWVLTAIITPKDATGFTITWNSSNPDAVSVTGNGLNGTINPVSKGTATITATVTTEDGDFTADCDVKVIGIGVPGKILENDIASEAEKPPSYLARDVVLSPRSVELRYQSNPANNGKMYLTYCSGDTPDNGKTAFPVYESVNGGKNFTSEPVGYVKDTNNGWGNDNCPDIYELPAQLGNLPAGTMICVGIATKLDYSTTSLDAYYSSDLGRNWIYLSTIAKGGGNNAGQEPLWEPHLLFDPESMQLICYYSDETDPRHNQKLVLKTTDDGENWGPVIPVAQFNDPGMRPGMFIVSQMENGYYIAAMELIGPGISGVPVTFKFSLNPNDPINWEHLDYGAESHTGWGSPYISTMNDGTLVLNSFSHDNLYVNTRKDGLGRWVSTPCPVRSGYNRQHYQLSTGELFVNMSPRQPDYPKNVWYGTREAPSMDGLTDTSTVNNLNVTATGRGTVSKMGTISVNSTTPYWLEAIPDAGATVEDIFVDNVSIGKDPIFRVTMERSKAVNVVFSE